MKAIEDSTIARAWLRACQHLLECREQEAPNLILSISQPTEGARAEITIGRNLDTFLATHGCYSNHTVAETIFPGSAYRKSGLVGVYKDYPDKIYPRIRSEQKWGTYAYRLLRDTDCDGDQYNPLEDCISRMQKRHWKSNYELSTYRNVTDRKHRMGGPCLVHVSFKLLDSSVHLTAMYRYHYYIQRAYGNLLGLARLQAFVAEQVNVRVGALVCHSTFAKVEMNTKKKEMKSESSHWGIRDVRALIDQCAASLSDGTT